MDNELNKYFPTDITNLILEMHYKSMFDISISKMKERMSDDRFEGESGSDSEDEDDDEDASKDWSETFYINSFIAGTLNQYKRKKEERKMEKQFLNVKQIINSDWMSPEQRLEILRHEYMINSMAHGY
jgi:hypothetical protein